MTLPVELARWQRRIRDVAAAYGLDFFETVFELVDWTQMNTVGAYGGFPVRYPHWRWGMIYDQISKSYSWGLSKIYELVINNDPCYAYLLRGNSVVEQKLVMAHVYGHCDFFKNNLWFAPTNRRMVDEIASHAMRISRYVDREGVEEVESFLDSCLSLENLIDIYAPYAAQRRAKGEDDAEDAARRVVRFQAKDYMDPFINPPEFIAEQRREIEEARRRARPFPERPTRDVLYFLMEHAPLKSWQRDTLAMIREEAYYFAPQALTKVMNEGWACLTGDARVFTTAGLMRIRDLVEARAGVSVSDGERPRAVVDWARFPDRKTIRIRTRRGYEIEGSATHRVRLPDGSWRRLDEIAVGDRVALDRGGDLWPAEPVALSWSPRRRPTLSGVAASAGVGASTAVRSRSAAAGNRLLAEPGNSAPFRAPAVLDERLGEFLGYLLSDGNVSRVKRVVSLTSGDPSIADRFATLARELFGLEPVVRPDGRRIRVRLYSPDLIQFLVHLGCPTGFAAARKVPPEFVLRSPRRVVAAYLRAYFDGDGYAGASGVILSTRSEENARLIQTLLVNFGVLSFRRRASDGCWRVSVRGRAAERYERCVGFGLGRKAERLRRYVRERRRFLEERFEDEIVEIARGCADVYDMTVAETHRYAADGLIHHNSYWHAKMMTEKLLEPDEIIEYADRHAGTMAVQPGKLNPYKLGLELFRHIEERWDKGRFGKEYDECDDFERKRRWDTKFMQGRAKIFEVRKIYNDVTFVDEFLTPEFCADQKLFTWEFNPKTGRKEMTGRDFGEIKDKLLRRLANGGHPVIEVVDANFRNRGELVLAHRHDGEDLQLDFAQETLKHLHRLWTRPVHLETVVEERPRRLSYDGEQLETADL